MHTAEIALNKLTVWEGNVRKTGAKDGLDELVASIASHGLLQPLVVMEAKKGSYHVVAGQRRLLALKTLANEGRIEKDSPIACYITTSNDAAEISLAENVVRTQMHPADQFEAFRAMVDAGKPVAEVAARFGVSESLIAKRMKLAQVSPSLLTEYRAGKMTLEQVMAFTVTDDHERQKQVWRDAKGGWQSRPDELRRTLTEGDVPANDKRVRFVTLAAYEAACGSIRRDLFDENNSGYIMDAALLDKLATEKLEALAASIRAEGWKWVECRVASFTWNDTSRLRHVPAPVIPLIEEQDAELKRLAAEYDELAEQAGHDEDNLSEDERARMEAIEQRIGELEDREGVYDDATKSIAGALISLDYEGVPRIERGYIRPEDDPAAVAPIDNATTAKNDGADEPKGLSASLIQELTARRTAALRAEIVSRPQTAFALVIHALLSGSSLDRRVSSCLAITAHSAHIETAIPDHEQDPAIQAMRKEIEKVAGGLPESDLLAWCFHQPQVTLMQILTVYAAASINATKGIGGQLSCTSSQITHADAIAKAINLDMTNWFTPTASNYFSRVGKSEILAALDEAGAERPPAAEKMKKAALAAYAEKAMADTGWLPATLRTESAPDESDEEESRDAAE